MGLISFGKGNVHVLVPLVAAFLVQLAGIAWFSGSSMNMDSFEYLELSRSILVDGEYSAPAGLNGYSGFSGERHTRMRQPLYPLFLAALGRVPGAGILPVQLIQAVMNCLSLWLVFASVRELSVFRLDGFSMLMPVIYFPWLLLSSMVLSETLFTFVLWASVFMLARYLRRGGGLYPAGAGILLGLLVLVKSIGLAVAVAIIVPLLIMRGGGIRAWLISAACAAAVLTPWAIRNYTTNGSATFLPTNSGYNLWVASRPVDSQWWDADEEFIEATRNWTHYYTDSSASDNFRKTAFENFRADRPVIIAVRALRRWFTAWFRFPGSGGFSGWNARYILLSAFQTVFVALAVYGVFKAERKKALTLLLVPVFALSCSLPVTKGLTRYLLPGWPAVALLAGHGLMVLLRGFRVASGLQRRCCRRKP